MSILLAVYTVFLLTYSVVMGFAVYKVFMFAKNKDLKGYSRRMTMAFLIIVLTTVFVDLIIIRAYQWNDDFSFYCNKALPDSCFCKTNDIDKNACYTQQKSNITEKLKVPNGINSNIIVK